jgi:hypothetical protein
MPSCGQHKGDGQQLKQFLPNSDATEDLRGYVIDMMIAASQRSKTGLPHGWLLQPGY